MRRLATAVPRSFSRRLFSLACGSTLIGVAVALLVEAHLGLAPYDVLSAGLASRIGVSLGVAGWALAAVLFVVATMLGRAPSAWGMAYVFANGLAIDAASGIVTTPDTLVTQLLFVGSAVVIMALGISLVVHSGTTGGPFELLMLAGEDRGISRLASRLSLDVGVLVIGILLGGPVGFGTLIYAATMGLVLHTVGQAFLDHRLGRQVRTEPMSEEMWERDLAAAGL